MDQKDALTNEKLNKKFKSQFDLVEHAIRLVDNMVKSGRSPRIKLDIQNPAVIVLEEIVQGRDALVDLPERPIAEYSMAVHTTAAIIPEKSRTGEKKKGRRLL